MFGQLLAWTEKHRIKERQRGGAKSKNKKLPHKHTLMLGLLLLRYTEVNTGVSNMLLSCNNDGLDRHSLISAPLHGYHHILSLSFVFYFK